MMQDTALQLTVPQIYARARAVLARNPHATGRWTSSLVRAEAAEDSGTGSAAMMPSPCDGVRPLYAAVGHLGRGAA